MGDETKLKGNCQHCGNKLKFAAHMAGMEETCPHCQQVTVLQAAVVVSATPNVSSTVSEIQPVSTPVPEALLPQQKIECPNCQASIEPEDRLCVQCGFHIPRPINWVRWGAVALIVIQLGYLTLRWVGLDPRVQHAFKAKLGLARAGVYAGSTPTKKVLGGAEGKDSVTDDVPLPPPETGAPRLVFVKQPELKEEGSFYFIIGTVQNNSATDTYFQVSVKFLLQDDQGNPLGIVQDYVALLDPGKTWGFRVLVVDPDATKYVFQRPIGGVR